MIAREAVLNDPAVAKLLRERFVPMALDNVDNPNWTPAEKEFLSERGGRACTQGMAVFTAQGKVLATGGGYEADGVRRMLEKALAAFEADGPAAILSPEGARRLPPEGGLVLYVTWKVLGLQKAEGSATTGSGRYDRIFQEALGVDRLWVRKDEAEALARGEFLPSLRGRMARYGVSYAVSGKAKDLDATLKAGAVAGSFRSDTGSEGALRGEVEAKEGRVVRFELLVRGWGERVEDCGFSAGLSVVPKGERVPVAVLFTLADPAEGLARVLPHHSRGEGYLR